MLKKLLILLLVFLLFVSGCISPGQKSSLKGLGFTDTQISEIAKIFSSEVDEMPEKIGHANASTIGEFFTFAFNSLAQDKDIQLIFLDLQENSSTTVKFTPPQAKAIEEIIKKKKDRGSGDSTPTTSLPGEPVLTGNSVDRTLDVFIGVKDPSRPNTTVNVLLGGKEYPVKLNAAGVAVVFVPFADIASLPRDQPITVSWTAPNPSIPDATPLTGSDTVTLTSPQGDNAAAAQGNLVPVHLEIPLTIKFSETLGIASVTLIKTSWIIGKTTTECAFPPTSVREGATVNYTLVGDFKSSEKNIDKDNIFTINGLPYKSGTEIPVNLPSSSGTFNFPKIGYNTKLLNDKITFGAISLGLKYKEEPFCDHYFSHDNPYPVSDPNKTWKFLPDYEPQEIVVQADATVVTEESLKPRDFTAVESKPNETTFNPILTIPNNRLINFTSSAFKIDDKKFDCGPINKAYTSDITLSAVYTFNAPKAGIQLKGQSVNLDSLPSSSSTTPMATYTVLSNLLYSPLKIEYSLNGVKVCDKSKEDLSDVKVKTGTTFTFLPDYVIPNCECGSWSACIKGTKTRDCSNLDSSCPKQETSKVCLPEANLNDLTVSFTNDANPTTPLDYIDLGVDDSNPKDPDNIYVGVPDGYQAPLPITVKLDDNYGNTDKDFGTIIINDSTQTSTPKGNDYLIKFSEADEAKLKAGDTIIISLTDSAGNEKLSDPVLVKFTSSSSTTTPPTDSTTPGCTPAWVFDSIEIPWSDWKPPWPQCIGGDQTRDAYFKYKDIKFCTNAPYKTEKVIQSRHCKDKTNGANYFNGLQDGSKQEMQYASAIDPSNTEGTINVSPYSGIPVKTVSFSDFYLAPTAKGSSSTPDKRFYHEVDLSTMPTGTFAYHIKDIPMPPEKSIALRIGFGKLGGDKNFALVLAPQFALGYKFADSVETYDGKNLYLGGRLYTGSLNYTYATPKQTITNQFELDSKSYWRTGLFIVAHNGWPPGTSEESAPVASNAKGVIEINIVPASSAPACQANC